MENQLISFETAKLAKKKGFNIRCKAKYIILKTKTVFKINPVHRANTKKDNVILVPTQSLLQKWLREKHNIHIALLPDKKGLYGFTITLKNQNHTQSNRFELDEVIGNYEEALEQGLIEALKLL